MEAAKKQKVASELHAKARETKKETDLQRQKVKPSCIADQLTEIVLVLLSGTTRLDIA